jgi:hypothetical protein
LTGDHDRPASSVRRSDRQVPLGQGALPSTHPISSETNVTEFGWKPAGTPLDTGVGDAVGAGVAVGDGEGLRLGEAVDAAEADALGEFSAGADEHAASSKHAAPVPSAVSPLLRIVLVINATNGANTHPVTTAGLGKRISRSALNRSRSRHRPRMAPD